MTFRMSLLSLLFVGVITAQPKADSMIKEVVGSHAPYFLGIIADDAVYAGGAVHHALNEGMRNNCAQARTDIVRLLGWMKTQIKNGGTPLLRTSWHGLKIFAGLNFMAHGVLPNSLLGIDRYDDGNTPLWKRAVQNVPGRVVGLGLMYHGLSGIMRQMGFESLGELYAFLEGRHQDCQDNGMQKSSSAE